MKIVKYIKYCLLLGVVFSLNSCLWDDKDIFDESSAQRLNEALSHTKDVLEASPNGWVMDYFATSSSGGYSLFVKFDSDGMATIGARNEYFPQFTTDTGMYDVIGDSGPVLTFNTYNPILHMFSNPENPDGLGLEGDYEFIVMNVSDDLIKLRGKKRGTSIILRKLSNDESWESQSTKLSDMSAYLFDSNVNRLNFKLGDKEYTAFDGATHVFALLLKGDDEIVGERTSVPFIVTTTGIRLYEPIEANVGDKTIAIQNFNVDLEKGALVSESDDVYITGPSAPSFFIDSLTWVNGKWKMDKNNLGGQFATTYAKIVENCKTVYKEDFDSFYFTYKANVKSRTFSFKSGKYEGAFNFSASLSESDKLIQFKNTGVADTNGKLYQQKIDGFNEMLSLLDQENYIVTADSPIRPTVLRFTSKTNASNWFKVSLTK